MKPTTERHLKKQATSALHCNPLFFADKQVTENLYDENFRSSYFGSTRKVLSPETISLEQNSYLNVKLSAEDLELNSPSSAISSLCQEHETKPVIWDRVLREEEVEALEQQQEEEDEVMSSYVIEINSDHREGTCEEVAIEEAIAWAKEKFQTHSNSEKGSLTQQDHEQSVEMDEGDSFLLCKLKF